jgi:hypothetical protein
MISKPYVTILSDFLSNGNAYELSETHIGIIRLRTNGKVTHRSRDSFFIRVLAIRIATLESEVLHYRDQVEQKLDQRIDQAVETISEVLNQVE